MEITAKALFSVRTKTSKYDCLILLRDFQLHEIALFFKSEICNLKSEIVSEHAFRSGTIYPEVYR